MALIKAARASGFSATWNNHWEWNTEQIALRHIWHVQFFDFKNALKCQANTAAQLQCHAYFNFASIKVSKRTLKHIGSWLFSIFGKLQLIRSHWVLLKLALFHISWTSKYHKNTTALLKLANFMFLASFKLYMKKSIALQLKHAIFHMSSTLQGITKTIAAQMKFIPYFWRKIENLPDRPKTSRSSN